MDSIRREASNIYFKVEPLTPFALKMVVLSISVAGIALSAATVLHVLEPSLKGWRIAPFKGNDIPDLCFISGVGGYSFLVARTLEISSPVEVRYRNHTYKRHLNREGKVYLTTLFLVFIAGVSLKKLQKFTKKKIEPLKGHELADKLFIAYSISCFVGMICVFQPVTRRFPEEMFDGLQGLSEAYFNREFPRLGEQRKQEIRGEMFEEAFRLANAQEDFKTSLDLLLTLANRESPLELLEEIEGMVHSEAFQQEYENDDRQRVRVLRHYIEIWALHDFNKAIEEVDQLLNGPAQGLAKQAIALEMIDAEQLEEAKELVRDIPDLSYQTHAKIVVGEVRGDPDQALEYARMIEDNFSRASALIEYARVDPNFPLKEIYELELLGQDKKDILLQLINIEATRNVDQAIAKIADLEDTLLPYQQVYWKVEAYINIAKVDADRGTPLALEAIDAIGFMNFLNMKFYWSLANFDPEAVLKRLKPYIFNPRAHYTTLSDHVARLEMRLGKYDAIKTLLAVNPYSTRLQNSCVDSILLELAESDLETAKRNIFSLPDNDPVRKVNLLSQIIKPKHLHNFKAARRF